MPKSIYWNIWKCYFDLIYSPSWAKKHFPEAALSVSEYFIYVWIFYVAELCSFCVTFLWRTCITKFVLYFFYFCLCKKTSKTLSQHTFLICKIFLCKTDFDWQLSISYNISHKRFKTQRKPLKKSKIKISFHSAGNFMFKIQKSTVEPGVKYVQT